MRSPLLATPGLAPFPSGCPKLLDSQFQRCECRAHSHLFRPIIRRLTLDRAGLSLQPTFFNRRFDVPSRCEVRPTDPAKLKIAPPVLGFKRCWRYAVVENLFADLGECHWVVEPPHHAIQFSKALGGADLAASLNACSTSPNPA